MHVFGVAVRLSRKVAATHAGISSHALPQASAVCALLLLNIHDGLEVGGGGGGGGGADWQSAVFVHGFHLSVISHVPVPSGPNPVQLQSQKSLLSGVV